MKNLRPYLVTIKPILVSTRFLELSNGPSMVQLGMTSWTISVLGSNGWSILDNGPNKCPRPIETMSKWTCPWTPNNIYNYFLIISLDFISKILKFWIFLKKPPVLYHDLAIYKLVMVMRILRLRVNPIYLQYFFHFLCHFFHFSYCSI